MEHTLLSQLLSLQCSIFHIPFYLYHGEKRLDAFEPQVISCDLVLPWLAPLIETNDSPNYLLTRDLLLLGRVFDNSSGLQIIIGPTRIGRIMETSLRSIMLSGRPLIGVGHLEEVGRFLNSCAAFPLEQFLLLLCSLHGFLNHEFISVEDIVKKDICTPSVSNTQIHMISATLEHTYEDTSRRNNFDLESQIMFYISHGMTKKLKELQFMYSDIGNLAHDSLRYHKNALIILNTLCQRASIFGGLDPEISYQLGEIYIQKIETCRDMNSLLQININRKLILDYCERVSQVLHPQSKHPKINDAMHYVRENYQKRLTVEEIAKEVTLSKEYLSSKFRQVTGTTLPAYINQQKITEAKQLLLFTDMSLSEITQYLSFSSQSYFQTIFKKITGNTPMEYRLENKIFI